jgi:hypothetical protein
MLNRPSFRHWLVLLALVSGAALTTACQATEESKQDPACIPSEVNSCRE